jgi:hypothetical protein
VKRIALVVLLAACARRTPPQATPADALRASVALEELEHGRTLLLGKCTSCHNTPLPEEHPPSEWPALVAEMGKRANTTAQQTKLIETYLVVMSERR